jgi:hypothetical protein
MSSDERYVIRHRDSGFLGYHYLNPGNLLVCHPKEAEFVPLSFRTLGGALDVREMARNPGAFQVVDHSEWDEEVEDAVV